MSAAAALPYPKVRWDLTALYTGIDDPTIETNWASVMETAERFAETYRGRINSPDLTAAVLVSAIAELEALYQQAHKPIIFANLLFAVDTADPAIGSFMQKQMEKMTELSVLLMFFELELQAAPKNVVDAVLADPQSENYRHYISLARIYAPHRLTEAEEIILEETANTGSRAWERLFDEVTSNHEFKFLRPGASEPEILTIEEVTNLLREADREVRQAAADSLSEGLTSLQRVITFIHNTLLQDKNVGDRLRKHPYPEHSRHLANELDQETVDLVIRKCVQNYPLVSRFYSIKRQILGLPELTHIDRYAPIFEVKEQVSYEDARKIVVDAFSGFSQDLATRADEFFTEDWIDAEPRKGKSSGAFCSSITPDTHPVVMMSYLNKMDDVSTLAHELGHGVHASLSRQQTYLNFHTTLPLAELASTFAEMLVFESLVSRASEQDKLALYAEKIEGIFATIFRQAAMFQFEQRCHRARREMGELTPDQIGDIWQEELQKMFGDSVKLGEQHRCWWSYIPHFISTPFYVYAYSFGELLALAIYQKAKDEGPSFAPKYEALLAAGGSVEPYALMQSVGVDLRDPAFWDGGFAALEKVMSEFEALWAARAS